MELLAQPTWMVGCAFAFGLMIGSFLNVVILRIPARLEWQWRRDSRELLGLAEPDRPESSGIYRRGASRHRRGTLVLPAVPPPAVGFRQHPGAVMAGAARALPLLQDADLAAIPGRRVADRDRQRNGRVAFRACTGNRALPLVFTWFLIALSGIDLRTTLLPDQLTYPLLWIGLLASTVTLFVDPVPALLGAAAGYLSLWSVFWAFKLITGKEGMGHGDFKLLAALGAWCGIKGVLPIVLISALLGAVIGSAWLWLRGHDRATQIPFGPYLAAAGWVQLLWGPQLIDMYLRLSGLR